MRRTRRFIVIGLSFLFICVLAIAVVSVAQASLPGDSLYQMKLALEQTRHDLSTDQVMHARLEQEYFERRLD